MKTNRSMKDSKYLFRIILLLLALCLILTGCGGGGGSGGSQDSGTGGVSDGTDGGTTDSGEDGNGNDGGSTEDDTGSDDATGQNDDDPGNPHQDPVQRLFLAINQIDPSKCPSIKMYVSITDQDGRPIEALPVGAFAINQDGQPLPISDVAYSPEIFSPVSVALAMDYSGSMDDADIASMESAAAEFVDSLGDEDWGEVIKFSQRGSVFQTFTPNRDALNSAIMAAWPFERTATLLYDSIMHAISDAATRQGRLAVLALTDGIDNASQATIDAVIAHAVESHVPVFTIGLKSGPEDNLDEAVLQRLAEASGGQYFFAPDSSQLSSIYRQISQILQNQHVLSFQTTSEDKRLHEISVTVDNDGLTDAATGTFIACSGAPALTDAGRIDTPGQAMAVRIFQDHAYIADGQGGMRIIDIRDADNPTAAGQLDVIAPGVPMDARDLDIGYFRFAAGNNEVRPYAFLADDQYGLIIVDISDPVQPAFLGGIDLSKIPDIEIISKVLVASPFIFLLDENAGFARLLAVVKDEDGSQKDFFIPTTLADVNGRDLVLAGRYAFVATPTGISVYDVNLLDRLEPLGSATIGHASGISLAFPYLYLAREAGEGMAVVDVSIPESPQIVDRIAIGEDATVIVNRNAFAYLASGANGITVVDVRNNNVLFGHPLMDGETTDMVMDGDRLYVTAGDAGLRIIEISD